MDKPCYISFCPFSLLSYNSNSTDSGVSDLIFLCRDTSRYGMGSETPVHPSRTPLHPYMTPMRDSGGMLL